METQSTNDGSILLRFAEYDTQIGIENAYSDQETGDLIVELPTGIPDANRVKSIVIRRPGRYNPEPKSENYH